MNEQEKINETNKSEKYFLDVTGDDPNGLFANHRILVVKDKNLIKKFRIEKSLAEYIDKLPDDDVYLQISKNGTVSLKIKSLVYNEVEDSCNGEENIDPSENKISFTKERKKYKYPEIKNNDNCKSGEEYYFVNPVLRNLKNENTYHPNLINFFNQTIIPYFKNIKFSSIDEVENTLKKIVETYSNDKYDWSYEKNHNDSNSFILLYNKKILNKKSIIFINVIKHI